MTVAILANVLVLAVPGGWMVLEAAGFEGPIERHLGTIGQGLAGLLGGPLVLMGVGNVVCLWGAIATRGPSKRCAIGFGVLSCGALVVTGVWLSFQINALVPLFVLGAVAFVTVRVLVRLRPALTEAGRCKACGYDLRGLPTAVCPECGDKAT